MPMGKNRRKNDSEWEQYLASLASEEQYTSHYPVSDPTNRLFVYGIFLGQERRDEYGMYNANYATVPGFITKGNYIVQAEPTDEPSAELTGLTVDVDPRKWPMIDSLEMGYDRVLVTTSNNEVVNMYVAPQRITINVNGNAEEKTSDATTSRTGTSR
jgi:hypothetical protein